MSLFTKFDGYGDRGSLSIRWSEGQDGPTDRRRSARDHLSVGVAGDARIQCARGLVSAAELKPGDAVVNGKGQTCTVAAVMVALNAPDRDRISIAPNALGLGLPTRTLVVGPRHRIRMASSRLASVTGQAFGSVAAEDLVHLEGVDRIKGRLTEVTHIVFETHTWLVAEGLVIEGFLPNEAMLGTLPIDLSGELMTQLPKLRYNSGAASYISDVPELDAREAEHILVSGVSFAANGDDANWSCCNDAPTVLAPSKDGRGPVFNQTVVAQKR